MSETITIRIEATDFEVDRAINAYIPILDCSYQLARGLPFRLPDGYQGMGRVSASAGDIGRIARAERAPEAMPEARAMAAATAHPDLFGFIVREVATGAIIISIRGTLVPEEWLRNFTVIPAEYSFLPDFGTTHLGFRLVYDSVRASIQQGLATVPPNARVTVVGHSLGGAMATLAGTGHQAQFEPGERGHLHVWRPARGQAGLSREVQRGDRAVLPVDEPVRHRAAGTVDHHRMDARRRGGPGRRQPGSAAQPRSVSGRLACDWRARPGPHVARRRGAGADERSRSIIRERVAARRREESAVTVVKKLHVAQDAFGFWELSFEDTMGA